MTEDKWTELRKWIRKDAAQVINDTCVAGGMPPSHGVARVAARAGAAAISHHFNEDIMVGYVAAVKVGLEDNGVDLTPAFKEDSSAEEFFAALGSVVSLMHDHTISSISTSTRACMTLCEEEDIMSRKATGHISRAVFKQAYEFFWHSVSGWVEKIVMVEYAKSGVKFPKGGLDRSQSSIDMFEQAALRLAEDVEDATRIGLNEGLPLALKLGGKTIH